MNPRPAAKSRPVPAPPASSERSRPRAPDSASVPRRTTPPQEPRGTADHHGEGDATQGTTPREDRAG
jgi:hypothetical protein